MQSFETIKISNITRFQEDNVKSPFKKHAWQKAHLRFKFIDPDLSQSSTSSSPTGASQATLFTQPPAVPSTTSSSKATPSTPSSQSALQMSQDAHSSFLEFQQHRKTLVLIGLVSCARERSVKLGWDKFRQLRQNPRFSSAILSRCFAVEPLGFPEQDGAVIQDENLVVIPNQQNKIDFYIETLLNDVASEVLRILEQRASNPQQFLTGYHSVDMYKAMNDASLQKRRSLRLAKIFGDYCLLAGDFADALAQYNSTIEQARTLTGEDLEIAGALEGASAALALQSFGPNKIPTSTGSPMPPEDEKQTLDGQFESIIKSCSEAISLYEKCSQRVLAIELSLKLAYFCVLFGGKERRAFLLDILTKIVADSDAHLPPQDRAFICGLSAKIAFMARSKRKFGFFLRKAALLYHQDPLRNRPLARQFLVRSFQAYDVPLRFDTADGIWKLAVGKPDPFADIHGDGWHEVQLRLILDMLGVCSGKFIGGSAANTPQTSQQASLQNFVPVSLSSQDYLTITQLILYALVEHRHDMSEDTQQQLFDFLCDTSEHLVQDNLAPSVIPYLCLKPIDMLQSIVPERLPPHLEPIAVEGSAAATGGTAGGGGVFIFNPFEHAASLKKFKVKYVVGELAKIKVTLRNPFLIDLKLSKIGLTLAQDSVPCEIIDAEGFVRGERTVTRIVHVKPLKSGQLLIDGVRLQFDQCHLPQETFIIPWRPKDETENFEATVVDNVPLLNAVLQNESITLVEGQRFMCSVLMQNLGTEPIDSISLTAKNVTGLSTISVDDKSFADKLPLRSGEQLIVPIEIVGRVGSAPVHNNKRTGSFDSPAPTSPSDKALQQMEIYVKYTGKHDWYRKAQLSIQARVVQGLVLERCAGVNSRFNRHVIAQVSNYADSTFTLFPRAGAEFIVLGPQESKIVLTDPKVVPGYSTTGTLGLQHSVASGLRWVSNLNTRGTVGLPQYEQSSSSAQNSQGHPSSTIKTSLCVESQKGTKFAVDHPTDQNVLHVRLGERIRLVSRIEISTTQLAASIGVEKDASPTDDTDDERESSIVVHLKTLQDAENGSFIVATPQQVASTGKSKYTVPRYEQASHEHSWVVFFLEAGNFRLCVDCTDGQQPNFHVASV